MMSVRGLQLGFYALAVGFATAAETRRPMVLMVMFDGMRADAIEAAEMPNLTKLRTGTWQEGYKGAWSLTGQTEPVAAPNSAPNHVSIATGVFSTKHGVSANGQIANGNYAQYPSWLKRVVDANSGRKALFVYSWSEDADLAPAAAVEFFGRTDAENAAELASRLASADAPDATLYFIDKPDASGHSSGFYPHSSAYLSGLAEADGYLGGCLNAIASRPTFAEEDWLILVTGDHGGYAKAHGQTSGRQAHTVPVLLAGRNITAGRLPGMPYNFDITASAVAHFGINPVYAGLDATLLDNMAVTDARRPLSDGMVVYLPFNTSDTENAVADSGIEPESTVLPALTNNGLVGPYLNITNGYMRLNGTENLTFEGGDKSFTAVVWVKMGEQSGDSVIFGNENWARGINPGVLLCAARKESASTAGVVMNMGSGSERLLIGTFDYEATSRWTFYAVTRTDEGVITTYQGRSDGTLNWASGTFNAFVLKTGLPFCIGQDGTGAYSKKFVGGVDDFALWTRGLSHDEIRRIYEYGRAGMELGDLLTVDATDTPTLEVTALDNEKVSLAFGGNRMKNHTLYVASGAADGGSDKYAWERFESVATITPETDTYVYTIPQALKDAQAKFRFFLLQTTDLPYVREVQFVQSDGGAYIDTGIATRRDMTATFDIRLLEQNGTWDWVFGAMGDSNKRGNFGLARDVNGLWHLEVSGNNDKPFECPLNVTHHVVFSPVLLIVNDEQHSTGLSIGNFIESGWTINLFRNLKLGAPYDQTVKGWYSSFALATPRRTVRAFTPAVDADGTAGMFDAVSGRFYTSGGDALTAGEDCDAARRGWVKDQSATLTASGDTPVTASWTGLGDPGDLADPANWACTNAFGMALAGVIPTAETDVTVSGVTAFAVPEGSSLTCQSITFAHATPTADADWRGLDLAKIADGSVIDLQGRSLTFAGFNGVVTAALTVTDSTTDAEHPGELHLVVGEGADFVNQGYTFDGNFRLIKEGAGTFTAMKSDQTYTGGTLAAEGCIKFGVSGGGSSPFGQTGMTVEVAAGATADSWSRVINQYHFILDGGTLLNTRNGACADMNQSIGAITLTADSEMPFDPQGSISQDKVLDNNTVWDLGGHTLTIRYQGKDPDVWFGKNGSKSTSYKLILKNGTVKTEGSGWWHDTVTDGTEGGSYDIGTILRHYGTSTVSNLTVRTTSSNVGDTGLYRVYGTLSPISVYGFNTLMLDGSTLDLSMKTGAWSTTFENTTSSVTFDENATITVNLKGRTDLPALLGGYVITWETEPEASAVFTLDEQTKKRGYTVVRDTAGVKLINNGTLVLIQ